MSNNESRRYKHDIKRVGDLAERPVEMFKREYDDKTSLVLKSRNIPENEIFVNINGISSVNPIYINTNVIPFQMSIDLDLSKSKYHYIKLEDDLFVNDIINFENGIEYRFYVNQDEVGSHNITFGNDINGLFKEFGLNLEPNTTTLIKITPINNVLYILFDTNSREIPFYITSFTPLNNSENININQNTLTATFTKEIVFGVGDISIKRFSDDSIFQTFVVDNEVTDANLVINGDILTINALDFEYDEQYYVTISNGIIESFDGITFAGISDKNTWRFKTAIPFTFTIDTTLGTGNSFDLPLRSGYNYDMLVDWGDGNTDTITSFDDINKTHTYATGGEYQISITGLCEAWFFNFGGDILKLTSIEQWGNTGFINMQYAFRGCSNLTTVNDTDGTWCSTVTNMSSMFERCSSLATLDVSNWNVSNVTNMGNMFNMFNIFGSSSSLATLDVNNWDVSNVTNMYGMFRSCSSLTTLDLSNWDVSNVSNIQYMFSNCSSLATLDVNKWDVSNVTDMYEIFRGCSSLTTLDVSKWNVSNVTNMGYMFYDCSSLTTLDVGNWNVSNVTNMYYMFSSCSSLEILNVSNWDVSNVIDMGFMFFGCTSLTTLNASNWNVGNTTSMSSMFSSCSSLETLDVSKWNVSNVTKMDAMFRGFSSSTTLDVSKWNVSNVTNMRYMFYNTLLDTTSYDALLISWSQLPSLKSNVSFSANLSQYSCAAEEAHNTLTSSPNNWTITDLGLNVDDGDSLKFTIDTTLGTGSSFNLPLREGYNYDFVVDWGDGNTSTVTSFDDVNKTHTYATGGEYQIKITGTCETWYFNNGGDRLKLTSIDQWGNTGFINMENAFQGCGNLISANDIDGTWCSNVTNMANMFRDCSSLKTLDVSDWNVSNVANMSGMFISCNSLTTLDVSNWDVSKVANMSGIFQNCSSLTTLDVSKWDVSNVTHMHNMFRACSSLETLDVSNWDVSNVTSMQSMFYSCSSLTTLDVSKWDVSNVTGMNSMFQNCSSLETLDVSKWNVSKVIYMQSMFYSCSSLTTLDVSKWDVSKVNYMNSMFQNCSSLETLDVSKWNVSNVTDMSGMFNSIPLDTPSYDALLIGWSGLSSLKSNIPFNADSAKYSSGAAADARQYIIDTYRWTITDAGQVV